MPNKYKVFIEVDNDAPILAKRIAAELNRQQMSQVDLSEATTKLCVKTKGEYYSVSEATLTSWLKGNKGVYKEPKINGLISVAKVLNVSTDYILGLSENPTTDENMKIAIKTTGLSEREIEQLQWFDMEKEALNDYYDDDTEEEFMSTLVKAEFCNNVEDREQAQQDIFRILAIKYFFHEMLLPNVIRGEYALKAVKKLLTTDEGRNILHEVGRIFSENIGDDEKQMALARVIEIFSRLVNER